MSIVDDDIESNISGNESFEQVVEQRLSRRNLLGGGVAMAVTASLGGVGSLLQAVPASAYNRGRSPKSILGFTGIPSIPADPTKVDSVCVPEGYTAEVLIAWGDPISDGPAFKQDASNSAAEQELQWGMHNDGMVFFPLHGSHHGLLVQNHEYTDDVLLFPDGLAGWNAEKTSKSLAAHGVGIVEVKKVRGKWQVIRPSHYARRITGNTPIRIGGPAKGDDRLKTSADPTGHWVRGTLNNCAMGYTPWGTYLACEENFNGYFRQGGMQTELERRYGITASGFGYLWHTTDDRFDVQKEPNEPNRFGWVTEINPFEPKSIPIKRTALGRFKHEGAWVQEARDGRVVVYSGDDEQGEYIYRYVSRLPWRKSFAKGIHPLNDGTLYVAKFHADGTGDWLPLTPGNPVLAGWSMADILINTRGAADLAGATRMDRPEWIDTMPKSLTAICTLTNNSQRGVAGGKTPTTDATNPRAPNRYGHIITWSYKNDWTEDKIRWDMFALCGDPANPAHGSTIVGDKYGSPDGIYIDPAGLIWIQTDVSGSTINSGAYTGFGNNQMLAADPVTRETRRFLTGPNICEVTGVWVTDDRRTMFVGIQHPGEAPSGDNDPADPKRFSSWPDGAAGSRPRSATIVVTKDDGGLIGS
ncbi:MAG TPA: PhoX family phosphatase [Steroidobacteraceae bacterium]|nr:PhoX family phosphatase [Steroidobacteraceae bacterium]